MITIEIKKKRKKKETDLPLFKLGVYKLSIYSLYIHLPSTENNKAVANKLPTGPAGTIEKTQISVSQLISKG